MEKLYKLLVVLLLIGVGKAEVFATEFAHEKSIEKSRIFAVKSEAYVEIENKYGDVEINTWDKDSVRIDVEIVAFSDDNSDLSEMLEMIDIDFTGTTSFVIVQTTWKDNVGILDKSRFRFNQGVGNNVKVEVNYKVYLPSNLSLDITNKFGNIFLADYEGDLEIDLSYGDLRAHHLENAKKIKIKSGKLKVKRIEKGHLNLAYAKSVNIDEANDLIIESSSSEITIDKVKDLNITSRHDDINIEEVGSMIGRLTLSDMYIDITKSNVNVITKYGTFVIKEIGADAEVIRLEGVKTDFRIGYSSVFFGTIEVDVSDRKDLSFGSDITITADANQEEDHWKGVGIINEMGRSKVIIKNKDGYVQLKGV